MRAFLLICLLFVACGGEVESFGDTEQLLECGAMPSLDECRQSDPEAFGSEGDPALICDGWPDNPYNPAKRDDFFQVVYAGGSRGIVSRINGEAVCRDRWK